MTLSTPTFGYNSQGAALEAFATACTRASLERLFNRLLGRPAHLLTFDDASRDLGTFTFIPRQRQSVPLGQIVGSVGRPRDYSPTFRPLRRHDAARWASVKRAVENEHGLPPIELYKIDNRHFVLDGHHRVSVLKQLGASQVEAFVTELKPLEPGMVVAAPRPSPGPLVRRPTRTLFRKGAPPCHQPAAPCA